jgi:hypothetical protein
MSYQPDIPYGRKCAIHTGYTFTVNDGDRVRKGQSLSKPGIHGSLLSPLDGIIRIEGRCITFYETSEDYKETQNV